jgi:hypothetical protein
MSHLAVNVLGTLHVVVEHRAVLLAGARQPALLAALVLGRWPSWSPASRTAGGYPRRWPRTTRTGTGCATSSAWTRRPSYATCTGGYCAANSPLRDLGRLGRL